MFSRMIPEIDNPTKVIRNTASAIDHIITNTVADTQFKSRLIQADLSDHFSVIFAFQSNENVVEKHDEHFVYKRCYDKKFTNLFK